MAQTPLTLHEREEISIALRCNPDESWAVMGRQCGRHPTTIRREVTANGGRHHYCPASADSRASKNRLRHRARRLSHRGPLRDRVIGELVLDRSPVAIWADLVADGVERVCAETIYAAVFSGTLGQGHGVPATWATPTTVSPAATRQQANGDRDDREPAR